MNLVDLLTRPLARKVMFETWRGMKLKPIEINSDSNPTFVIEDPMKRIHKSINKSTLNFANTINLLVPFLRFDLRKC